MLTDLPGVNMAFSLHAPTQELRQQIVPSAKNYPLDKILQVIDEVFFLVCNFCVLFLFGVFVVFDAKKRRVERTAFFILPKWG